MTWYTLYCNRVLDEDERAIRGRRRKSSLPGHTGESVNPITEDTIEKLGRTGVTGILEDVVRVVEKKDGRKPIRLVVGPDLFAVLQHEKPVVSGVPVSADPEMRPGVIFAPLDESEEAA